MISLPTHPSTNGTGLGRFASEGVFLHILSTMGGCMSPRLKSRDHQGRIYSCTSDT